MWILSTNKKYRSIRVLKSEKNKKWCQCVKKNLPTPEELNFFVVHLGGFYLGNGEIFLCQTLSLKKKKKC